MKTSYIYEPDIYQNRATLAGSKYYLHAHTQSL
jgi:hypothetical protein